MLVDVTIKRPTPAHIKLNHTSFPVTSSTFEQHYDFHSVTGIQQGYKINEVGIRAPIHSFTEDFSIPACTSGITIKNSNLDASAIYILADGHGGHGCAEFMTSRCHELLQVHINRQWDLSLLQELSALRTGILEIYEKVDSEYCTEKARLMTEYAEVGGVKPTDDGCTLVCNIILVSVHGKWIINVNVGDSRTLINTLEPCRPTSETDDAADFTGRAYSKGHDDVVFVSLDHNMQHVGMLRHITSNGGKLLSPLAMYIDPRFIDSVASSHTNPISNARIFRPQSDELTVVGVSHKRTLNLTSTMGDLLFKVKPAVMSCIPDITVIPLDRACRPSLQNDVNSSGTTDTRIFILVATDGLYDHMRVRDCKQQSALLTRYIRGILRAGSGPELQPGMLSIVDGLVSRSPLKSGLFIDGRVTRFDDCLVQLIVL